MHCNLNRNESTCLGGTRRGVDTSPMSEIAKAHPWLFYIILRIFVGANRGIEKTITTC